MYRILTERKNADQVKTALGVLGFDYTVFDAQGSWHGQTENSMAIELDGISWEAVTQVACLIKALNNQQAVLIQTIPTTSLLI
jgi:hypothetical protein